jgi:hypothetical protein
VTRWLYEARLVPIGTPVNIPDANTRQPNITTFHERSFEIERTSKTKPEIWVDHDPDIRVGKVWLLYTSRSWWMCDMALDPELPNELELGQPLSVGLSYLRIGSGEPYLREISIVPHGAVAGAEITRRSELPPAKPAKPTPSPPPPNRTTTNKPAVVAHPRTVATRTQHEEDRWAEVSRRMDRIERLTGRPANMEDVLAAMHLELHGPTLEELYAKHVLNRRAA